MIRTEVLEHGRLRDLRALQTPSTPLDLDALRSVRETGALPRPVATPRGFFRQWRDAVLARGPLLHRLGLMRAQRDLSSPRGREYEIREGAERMVESRMAQRDRTPMTLQQLVRRHAKPMRLPEAGQSYRGALVAYAREEDGSRYAVLDTGRHLTAFATQRRDLDLGADVRARARILDGDRERRRLTWVLDDLERQREHGRGR